MTCIRKFCIAHLCYDYIMTIFLLITIVPTDIHVPVFKLQLICTSFIIFFSVRLHPRKPILATTSDDHHWKMWSVPSGEIIMTGEGHTDWVSGCDFHPS